MNRAIKTVIAVAVLAAAGSYLFYYLKNRTPFADQRPAVREMAPEISLADLSGSMIRLSELRGKIVLLAFWASWCPPCKSELKEFQKVYEKYEDRGFEIIALALNEIPPSLVADLKVTFPVAVINDRVKRDYGNISNVPVSFLLDQEGRIIRKLNEVYPAESLVQDIGNAMKGGGAR